MKVFIVILNWNGKDFILPCLDSVWKLEIGSWKLEIVMVDNASTDGSDRLVEKRYKDVTILRNKENLGFAEGNNVGIRYSLANSADYVIILNPDTVVDKDLIIQLIKAAESNPQIGIASPKIYFAPGFEFHKDRYGKKDLGKIIWYAGGIIDWDNIIFSHRGVDEVDTGQYDQASETDFVTGCCMLIKREVFEKVGFLDEKYFLYLEDNDFCQKAKSAGFKLYFIPQAEMYHLNAGSSKVGGSLQDYYLTRNRMLFGMRFAQFRAKAALFRQSLKLLISGRPWQKKGILDFYLRRVGKGSYK